MLQNYHIAGETIHRPSRTQRIIVSPPSTIERETPWPISKTISCTTRKSCPYCVKVLRFLDANGITLDLRDTMQPGNQNDLVRIGGKNRSPAL